MSGTVPHFSGRVLGFTLGPLGLAGRGVTLRAVCLAVGGVCRVESLVWRVETKDLCALLDPSSQALCLGFSICQCGLCPLSWTSFYPGAIGYSWWGGQVTVTKSLECGAAPPSSGLTYSPLDAGGGGPEWDSMGWQAGLQEQGFDHLAGRWVGRPGRAEPVLPAVTRCPSGRPPHQAGLPPPSSTCAAVAIATRRQRGLLLQLPVEVPGGRAGAAGAGPAAMTPASRMPLAHSHPRAACVWQAPLPVHDASLAGPGLDPGSGWGWRLARAGAGVGRRHTAGCSRPQSSIVKAQ